MVAQLRQHRTFVNVRAVFGSRDRIKSEIPERNMRLWPLKSLVFFGVNHSAFPKGCIRQIFPMWRASRVADPASHPFSPPRSHLFSPMSHISAMKFNKTDA